MIKEAYVSFETAKLLKEKGFDWGCNAIYGRRGEFQRNTDRAFNNGGLHVTSAPTHQMAMAWLREEHNILIIPRWIYDNNNSTIVYGYTIFKVFPLPYKDYSSEPIWYIEYDEAIEAALKYSLENLI